MCVSHRKHSRNNSIVKKASRHIHNTGPPSNPVAKGIFTPPYTHEGGHKYIFKLSYSKILFGAPLRPPQTITTTN